MLVAKSNPRCRLCTNDARAPWGEMLVLLQHTAELRVLAALPAAPYV